MASLGLPPIMTAFSNLPLQREALVGWKEAAQARGMDVDACRYPMMVNCIIADSDAEAYDLAKRYIPRFQQAQIDHYEGRRRPFRDALDLHPPGPRSSPR